METPLSPSIKNQLTDIVGLRLCGIFPAGKEPSIRTLRKWTKRGIIPHQRIGHFVYYDLSEVIWHIRTNLKVPALD
jgi:hypothetical protein